MIHIFKHVKDLIQGKTDGTARSGKWSAVRKAFLVKNANCVVCGGTKKLEVHHIKPFHLHPKLELEPTNLVTLCENMKDGLNCHLAFGHLGNFKSWNTLVKADSAYWHDKIKERP